MADIQGPFVDLRTFVNGNISDINLSSTAAIAETKLANGSSGLAKGSFSAYRNAALGLATGSVVVFDTDSGTDAWDTSSWYDTTTGTYTPQVAGIYRFSWLVTAAAAQTADVFFIAALLKNGTTAINAPPGFQRGAVTPLASGGSVQARANGTTDTFQIRLSHNAGGSPSLLTTVGNTYFQGELIGRS